MGKILTPIVKGKLTVLNLITGRSYPITSDSLILGKESGDMSRFLRNLIDRESRTTHRLPPGQHPKAPKVMPLTLDELTAHTTLRAVTKALDRIRSNVDSFRNPKLLDLVLSARNALKVCLDELESYDEYPQDD